MAKRVLTKFGSKVLREYLERETVKEEKKEKVEKVIKKKK